MKYIGLDLATTTGWSFFEDDVLLERGTIQLISAMELPQKLHYLHLELDRLLRRLQPEWCFIEDVILAISGAKTLAYLARLNGVAINTAFSILQERVKLYEPPYWKSHSFDGLNGHANKWQIQLAVIQHYNIHITGDFQWILSEVNENIRQTELKRDEIITTRTEINKMKAKLVKKRDPLTDDVKKAVNCRINQLESICQVMKDDAKRMQKDFDKKMIKVTNNISAQTGITDNVADSCGVAYCGWKEITNV